MASFTCRSANMPKSIYSERHELLCELLTNARLEANLTQQTVADRLGQPQSYIAKIEGGERRLDVIEFIELCEQIETDPQRILAAVSNDA